jgi:hypothetical protein
MPSGCPQRINVPKTPASSHGFNEIVKRKADRVKKILNDACKHQRELSPAIFSTLQHGVVDSPSLLRSRAAVFACMLPIGVACEGKSGSTLLLVIGSVNLLASRLGVVRYAVVARSPSLRVLKDFRLVA